jgi:hypothetical protein
MWKRKYFLVDLVLYFDELHFDLPFDDKLHRGIQQQGAHSAHFKRQIRHQLYQNRIPIGVLF